MASSSGTAGGPGGTRPHRPIGYYVKELDRALEARFERDLAEHQLSRRHWQVLNVLSAAPSSYASLSSGLRSFWTDGSITLDSVLAELGGRDAVARAGDHYELTVAGSDLHRAVSERVARTRERLMDGLTGADYVAVVSTLARMIDNLTDDT